MKRYDKRFLSYEILMWLKRAQATPEFHLLSMSIPNLDYSRVEVAADTRHRVRSCGISPRVPCNEVDVVRSARL